ncbi:venom allergen 5 [Anabrus simplex]|uniref:venom allergen 5 n=1 Tax=Anabrus simplex TaxID=316456 RepID=UPI0035A2ABBA
MLVKLSACLLTFTSVVLALTRNEYCGIKCREGVHTMCIYDGVSKACSPDGKFGVDDDQKALIVDLHNRLRNDVASGKEHRGLSGRQPQASNMKKLVWDDEVAKVAQRWADQCTFEHDKCRNDPRFPVGQSMGWAGYVSDEPDWEEQILDWYNEVKNCNMSILRSYTPAGVGHYTQIVWAETEVIGCGYRTDESQTLYVCNYGPSGNVLYQQTYQFGPARSACRDSPVDPEYPALC